MVVVGGIKPNSMLWLLLLAGAMMLLIYTFARRHNWPEYRIQVLPVEHTRVFGEEDLRRFLEAVRNKSVVRVENSGLGTWAMERDLNLITTLDDGSASFTKWRPQALRLQGDLYAYYLNCYLGLWNAPPTALLCVHPSTEWRDAIKDLPSLKKREETTCFVSTQFIPGLKNSYAPTSFATKTSTTVDELKHLMQWSDMIVFDYICGHSDRMTINLLLAPLNLDISWIQAAKNAAYTDKGDLLLFDHESAFDIGYGLAEHSSAELSRQTHFLRKLSLFRKSTAETICHLCQYEDPASVLEKYTEEHDPVSYSIASKLATKHRVEFKKRLLTVCDIVCCLLSNESNSYTASMYE